MKPYNADIIADYIITRLNADDGVSLINLKLQKLLYYVQGWSLGITKEKFLNCDFEAWVHGPVCREIYERFKSSKNLYSYILNDDRIYEEGEFESITKEDRDFVDYILDNYAGFSGAELESMTHKERPWIEARNGCSPMDACQNKISDSTMMEYFGEKWAKIDGE
ncbi:MAG: DUF4065 domain-containing protein [Muribaculaceae bacterium]|nr:DUF4065 domain-containing protein [Muribaculaceae bacterium]